MEHADSVDEIESYPKWPKTEWYDFKCVGEQARLAKEMGKVVVFMGDRLNRCAQLKPAMYVRWIEQILIDTISNPEIAKTVFRRITDFYIEYARNTLEAAENNIDIFFTGDDFGEHISFHGGISIQKTMPSGTREDIQNEVKDRAEKLAPDGGYIFCTAHNLQVDTSLENVETLFKAYKEFGKYE